MSKLIFGIADCNGVESMQCYEELTVGRKLEFVLMADVDKIRFRDEKAYVDMPAGTVLHALRLRAQANDQRQAIVYMAKVEDDVYEYFKELMKEGQGGKIEMLNLLKDTNAISTPRNSDKVKLTLIPNSKLDPYGQ